MNCPTKKLIFKQIFSNIYIDIKKVFISDKVFNYKLFLKNKGYEPNLTNPVTFSEKLIYLKEHYRNPLEKICTDKYLVKEYIRQCGCSEIINEPLAVYDKVSDIEMNNLPERFFIRCNHMSGSNYIYDKNNPNSKNILSMLSVCMNHDWYNNLREWNYKNISRKIICEELLLDKNGNMPIDYKFYCFSGEPRYYMISLGEYSHKIKNHKFSIDGKSIDKYFKEKEVLDKNDVILPNNFNEMIKYVKILCKPFPHVRVDLYNIDGKIIFGELTFYSNGGVVSVQSKEFEKKIGSWIKLENYKKDMI